MEDPPPAREQTRVRRVVDEGVGEPPAVAVVRHDQGTRGELLEGIGRERVVEQCLDRRLVGKDADDQGDAEGVARPGRQHSIRGAETART